VVGKIPFSYHDFVYVFGYYCVGYCEKAVLQQRECQLDTI